MKKEKPTTDQTEDREPQKFEVLKGLSYEDVRREPGDIVDDLPADSIFDLIEQEAIRPIEVNNA